MAVEMIWLAIALLLAPALGEIAKIRTKADKGFTWIAVAGAMFLLAAAFEYVNLGAYASTLIYGTMLFSVIGLICVLVGAIIVLISAFK